MISTILLASLAASAEPAGDPGPLSIDLRLLDDFRPVEDEDSSILLTVRLADGWSPADGKLGRALVQVQVPDSADLDGPYLRTHEELARNEFLQAPYERLVPIGEQIPIGFSMFDEARDGEAFRVNVLVYATPGDGADMRFLRRRYELPIRAGARAVAIRPVPATFGDSEELGPGDEFPDLELPRADGRSFDLSEHLGDRMMVVVTYRAFW